MKNLTVILLAVAVIALGAWCMSLHSKLNIRSAQLAQAQANAAAAEADLLRQKDENEHGKFAVLNEQILQEALVQTEAGAAAQSRKADELLQRSLAAAKTNNPVQVFATILKDPKMREAFTAQQKVTLGPVLDKQFGALFQQLNLTPDQTTTLKDLMEKKMLVQMDAGYSTLDSSLTAAQRAEMTKQVKDQTDDIDNQIKQFLGDEKYGEFQSYQKTLSDRMMVSQLSDQLSGTANALTTGEQQQLMQAMGDVRDNFKWSSVLHNNREPSNGDYASVYTQDNIDQYVQEQEQYDQEVSARAQQILSADQFARFQDHQKLQRQLEMASIKMIAQIFGSKN